jgi:predicted phage terminase large subunit-like protein
VTRKALLPAQTVADARENPLGFIALAMNKTVSDIQRDLIHHALTSLSWYAEVPRGHAKTTTMAFMTAWWLGVRPGTRFKIVSQNDEAAGQTTKFIREIIRSDAFRAVFPGVKIKSGEEAVTSWSVTAPGLPSRRDPSVQGSGVFGRTGGRADVLWFDDICDLRNAVLQPTLRDQVKEAVANIWMPMLDPAAEFDSRVWKTATPFHTDDVTADWRRYHEQDSTLLRLPCRGDISPWPEVFTEEYLRKKREEMGAMAYARAYELIPLSSDLLIFQPGWIGHYRQGDRPKVTRTIAALDWGYGKREQERDDPDYSVCIVAEVDGKRDCYVTDIIRVRESFPTFARMAADLLSRRGVSVVLAEANGPQKGIFDQFREMTTQPMLAVERNRDKHLRAAGAQPFVQGGKLRFPTDEAGRVLPAFQPVIDEMLAFPAGSHDDTVDVIVDLCAEAVRGSLSKSDLAVKPIQKPDAITRMFGSNMPRRPMFPAG